MPKWFIFLSPASIVIAQWVASGLTHWFIRELVLKREELTGEEERIANMYVSVFSFFVSLLILLILSWVYVAFAPGFARWTAWVVIAFCVVMFISVFPGARKLVKPEHFEKGRGRKILHFYAQFKSGLFWIRFVIVMVGIILALIAYKAGGQISVIPKVP